MRESVILMTSTWFLIIANSLVPINTIKVKGYFIRECRGGRNLNANLRKCNVRFLSS